MLQSRKRMIVRVLCAVMAVVTLTAGFAGGVYAETAPMEEALHDAVIIGILELILLAALMLRRIKGENTDWFEKIPLAHRMTSFRPRYNMK